MVTDQPAKSARGGHHSKPFQPCVPRDTPPMPPDPPSDGMRQLLARILVNTKLDFRKLADAANVLLDSRKAAQFTLLQFKADANAFIFHLNQCRDHAKWIYNDEYCQKIAKKIKGQCTPAEFFRFNEICAILNRDEAGILDNLWQGFDDNLCKLVVSAPHFTCPVCMGKR